jgi:hypothetical protein
MAGIKYLSQVEMLVAPVTENNLVRLQDMIDYVQGMTKQPVRAVLTSPFVGTYNGTNLTLTQTIAAEVVVDGVTLALGDRVLLAGQTDRTQNGIYTITTLGEDETSSGAGDGVEAVLTRADDMAANVDLVNGVIVPVSEGDINAGSRWKLTVGTVPAILDVTNLDFAKEIVDFTKVIEMSFLLEGDDDETLYEIEHNLGTRNVSHEIRDNATGETVFATFRRMSINDVEVEFGVPAGTGNDYTLILKAQVTPI